MFPPWSAVVAGTAVSVSRPFWFRPLGVRFRHLGLPIARNVPRAGRRVADLPPGISDILSVLRSAAMVLDTSGAVVRASAAAYAFGLVRDGVLVHPELRAFAAEVRRTGSAREQEAELARGPLGGGRLMVQVRAAPLAPRYVLLLVDDRTEAARLEKIRRDFVANVSHELKTPVGSLRLLAEAVHEAADDPESVRHFSEQMERESCRLTTLVQEIIDLSRLQVADVLHPPEPVPVTAMIAEAVDRCRLGAQAKNMTVVVAGDSDAVVFGVHDLLVTAVGNLVGNAIAYSPEGTTVSVETRHRADLVEIMVRDQGIGIAAEELSRIFERFYRVDKARSRATGGTGLGLSIVKHVADNHGGEVTVCSLPGHGSTFTLRLPDGGRPGSWTAPTDTGEPMPADPREGVGG